MGYGGRFTPPGRSEFAFLDIIEKLVDGTVWAEGEIRAAKELLDEMRQLGAFGNLVENMEKEVPR